MALSKLSEPDSVAGNACIKVSATLQPEKSNSSQGHYHMQPLSNVLSKGEEKRYHNNNLSDDRNHKG